MALPRLKLQLSKRRLSSQQRLDLLAGAITLVLLALQTTLWQPGWLVSTAIIAAGVLLAVLQRLALAPLQREINALNLHAQNLQDGSFNTSANQLKIQELGSLASSLQNMSAQLRAERAKLFPPKPYDDAARKEYLDTANAFVKRSFSMCIARTVSC